MLVAIENAMWPGPVHRRRRNQPQGRQMGPAAEEPHPGGGRRLAEHRGHRRRGDGGDARRDALKFCALSAGRLPHCRYNGHGGSRLTDSGEYPRDIDANIRHSRHFRLSMPEAPEVSPTEGVYVAATKASPATDEPVKRTATKSPAKPG